MTIFALTLLALPAACFAYAYIGYPAVLLLLARRPPGHAPARSPARDHPSITITLPVYNEERVVGAAIEHLLALDYPPDRREIVVISDGSTDGTDAVVAGYADRGVRLLRLPERAGKSAAENAAGRIAAGDILVNIDATTRTTSAALRALVAVFDDPTVGVASGRDVSVGRGGEANRAESGYVGYEMWLRGLETRAGSIVGASGCFYGMRRSIYPTDFPSHLSRDFASAMVARRAGFRSVSVDDAVCFVPRATALDAETRRKARTMARGLATLWHMRELLDPVRHGRFAFMLASHKLCRWLVYLLAPGAVLGLFLLGTVSRLAAAAALMVVLVAGLGFVGVRWPRGRSVPGIFAVPGFVLASGLAGALAWWEAARGRRAAMWEPTRRAV